MKALYVDNRLDKVLALKAASKVSRFAALGPLSPLRYGRVPEPVLPGERWLKVDNAACGLCGTDIHLMFMDMDPKCFPAALPGLPRIYLGHEVLGRVRECGSAVRTCAPGDRVALRIDWPSCFQMELDPPCPRCADGDYMLCERGGEVPLPKDPGGGFSPRMVLHETQAFRVPDALTDHLALLLEPAAVACHAAGRLPVNEAERLLVVGAGTIGLLLVARLRSLGRTVDCLARHPFQADLVRKLGGHAVTTGPGRMAALAKRTGARHVTGYLGNEILLGGYDVVFDTVGNDASFTEALRVVRGGGHVGLVGINFTPGRIDYTPIWHQEVTVVGVNSHATEADGRTSFDHAAQWLSSGALDAADFLTHRYAMKDYKRAVKAFLDKGRSRAVKIVLEH